MFDVSIRECFGWLVVCFFAWLFGCLVVWLFVCLFVWLVVCLFVCLFGWCSYLSPNSTLPRLLSTDLDMPLRFLNKAHFLFLFFCFSRFVFTPSALAFVCVVDHRGHCLSSVVDSTTPTRMCGPFLLHSLLFALCFGNTKACLPWSGCSFFDAAVSNANGKGWMPMRVQLAMPKSTLNI